MNYLIVYLLKVVLCSAIFYGYYLLVLQNKNFHPYNRFYLLSTAILSVLLPLLHISMFDFTSDNERILALLAMLGSSTGELPTVMVGQGADMSWLTGEQICIIIYLSVTLALIVLMAVRIFKVYALRKRFPIKTIDRVNFINTNIDQAPFSFLNNLFWRKDIVLTDKIGEQIYRHEMAHIRQRHSLDKILLQVLSAAFWMNPVYYYMQKELLLIHEFMADQKAIEEGDGEAFARMLLATQLSGFKFEPAHSLSYSSIKKRLHMITNSHKPKYSYLRRLLFLPLLFSVTFVFALRAHQKQVADQTADLKAMVVAVQMKDSTENNGNPKTVIFKSTDSTEPTLVRFQSKATAPKPLITIDGKEQAPGTSLDDLNAGEIESIHVYKEKYATGKYGQKGKNGVVEVITKAHAAKAGKTDMRAVTIVGYKDNKDAAETAHTFTATGDAAVAQKSNQNEIVVQGYPTKTAKLKGKATGLRLRGATGTPLYVVDGKKITEEEMKAISPNDIEAISVLKDKSATERYGKAAANGAVLITMKKGKSDSGRQEPIFNEVQIEPRFPGGTDAWRKYLERNLKSSVAVHNGAPVGTYEIIVSFLVDKKGNTSEFNVVSKPDKDYGTAAEAARVIKESGRWIPAQQNGKTVTFRQKQKLIFQVSQ